MTASKEPTVLLALDAGVRETGWAVFEGDEVIESGVTGLSTRRTGGVGGPGLPPAAIVG